MKILISIFFCFLFLIGQTQNTCPPTFICNTFSTTPNGSGSGGQFGEINSLTDGCLNGEHNSTWLTITILTSGTLQFTIDPINNNNDFDFAVWGPNFNCIPTSSPIRCSYAINNNNFFGPSDNGNTGINSLINATHPSGSEFDNSEGSGGNGWVNDINVLVGQQYLILVDNFTTNNGFQISFGGTSTLNCSSLPIELISFIGKNENNSNSLEWITATEIDNDYFTVERSADGMSWETIGYVSSLGNSNEYTMYSYNDNTFKPMINYYRLSQTDFNGYKTSFNIIAINNIKKEPKLIKILNLMGAEVSENYHGVKLFYYDNNTVIKRLD